MENITKKNLVKKNGVHSSYLAWMKERCLIVTDLDGTLLNNKEEITNFTLAIIKKIVDAGHIFAICTGRPLRCAIDYYRQLNLNSIIGNLNGAIISNPSNPNFDLINLTFSKEILNLIFTDQKILNNIGCIFVENILGSYLFSNDPREYASSTFLNKFHVNKNDNKLYVNSYEDYHILTKDCNSVLIYVKNKSDIDYLSNKIKELTSALTIRTWSLPNDTVGTVLEINSIFSNKGTFIKFLSSYYTISLKHTYTFGDSDNDLEMIQKANGYAMKNGSHYLKFLATKITVDNNDNDGVAKELLKIFFNHS